MEDLERLEALDKDMENMFDEKGTFKITNASKPITFNNVVKVGEELVWLSTFLYKLLRDITEKYEASTKRTIKILDRINSRLQK